MNGHCERRVAVRFSPRVLQEENKPASINLLNILPTPEKLQANMYKDSKSGKLLHAVSLMYFLRDVL